MLCIHLRMIIALSRSRKSLCTNQWLTTHTPNTSTDLGAGLRANFNPRARWKAAINTVRAATLLGNLQAAAASRHNTEDSIQGLSRSTSQGASCPFGIMTCIANNVLFYRLIVPFALFNPTFRYSCAFPTRLRQLGLGRRGSRSQTRRCAEEATTRSSSAPSSRRQRTAVAARLTTSHIVDSPVVFG